MSSNDDRTIVCSPEDMSAGKLCSSCGQVAKGLPAGAAFCPNCGCAFSQVRDFGPGTVVGQYRILKELGTGGIGQVFMAHPIDNPNMRIALKVLQKEFLDNATVRERFNREIRLLASLNLDYIVRYYNSWNDEDGEYLAMEYIDGMNLSQMVDQDYEFTPDVVLEIMETLAMVFHYDLQQRRAENSGLRSGKIPQRRQHAHPQRQDHGVARFYESGAVPQRQRCRCYR